VAREGPVQEFQLLSQVAGESLRAPLDLEKVRNLCPSTPWRYEEKKKENERAAYGHWLPPCSGAASVA